MFQGGQSVVQDQGPYASTCGYCKSNGRTSVSYGLWAQSLTVHDYQGLLDQGWRRSGMFLYKPQIEKTCCPPYAIRLRVDSFIPSKEQNRVLRRMERHLDGNGPQTIGELQRESNVLPERIVGSIREDSQSSVSNRTSESSDVVKNKFTGIDEVARDLSMAVEAAIRSCITAGELPAGLENSKVSVQRIHTSLKRRLKDLTGDLLYTCSVAFPIAATLKHMHADERLKNVTSECEPKVGAQKENVQEPSAVILAELLSSKLQSDACLHGFNVQACRGHINFLSMNSSNSEHQSCAKASSSADYTSSENKEAATKTSAYDSSPVKANHVPKKRKLEIQMRRSEFDPEEFALYKKYQIAVHKDNPEDVKECSYQRFLVDSPLIFIPPSSDNTTPSCGFGSFHQQYLIDGRLVAVGVVDVLPFCLSSKYLFWDPDLAFLSLGKYSALREIMWVQEAHKSCPALEFYYLGYYIHSCKKMRYKAEYVPSELLCPVRFQWVPFRISRPLLVKQSYVCLSDYLGVTEVTGFTGDSKIIKDSFSISASVKAEAHDIELDEVGSPRPFKISQSIELASSSKESEDLSNILLKLGGQFIRFKHLEACSAIPRKQMDTLVYHLQKYSQVVGPPLAAKMAYSLW